MSNTAKISNLENEIKAAKVNLDHCRKEIKRLDKELDNCQGYTDAAIDRLVTNYEGWCDGLHRLRNVLNTLEDQLKDAKREYRAKCEREYKEKAYDLIGEFIQLGKDFNDFDIKFSMDNANPELRKELGFYVRLELIRSAIDKRSIDNEIETEWRLVDQTRMLTMLVEKENTVEEFRDTVEETISEYVDNGKKFNCYDIASALFEKFDNKIDSNEALRIIREEMKRHVLEIIK